MHNLSFKIQKFCFEFKNTISGFCSLVPNHRIFCILEDPDSYRIISFHCIDYYILCINNLVLEEIWPRELYALVLCSYNECAVEFGT